MSSNSSNPLKLGKFEGVRRAVWRGKEQVLRKFYEEGCVDSALGFAHVYFGKYVFKQIQVYPDDPKHKMSIAKLFLSKEFRYFIIPRNMEDRYIAWEECLSRQS